MIIVLLLSGSIRAESNIESIKYEILRETIHFLATDAKVSNNSTLEITCANSDYDCFEKQLANTITGISRWFKSWKEIKVADSEDLIHLKNTIHKEIVDRDGKSYRKDLPGYQSYLSKLDHLMDAHPLINQDDDPPPTVRLAYQSGPAQATLSENAIDNAPTNNPNHMLLYLALALGGLALFFALRPPALKKETEARKKQIAQLSQEVARTNSQIEEIHPKHSEKKTKEAHAFLQTKLEGIEKRLVELENKEPESHIVWKEEIKVPQVDERAALETFPPDPVNNLEVKYAKFLDLDNGFSSARLKSTQNGELVYEIEIDGETATYSISEDPKAQKYGLFNFEYLKSGCEFENQPGEGDRIVTVKKGRLCKSGTNWIIQSNAIIRFS